MAFIKLNNEAAEKYRSFLAAYRQKTGQEPDASIRTEAFFCARSNDPWNYPSWCK